MDIYIDMSETDKQLLARMVGKDLWIRCKCRALAIGSRPNGDIYLNPLRVGDECCVAQAYPVDTTYSLRYWQGNWYSYDLRTLDIIRPVEVLTAQELHEQYEPERSWGDIE